MRARSINNCFGDGSPGWNVEFPAGNLTAAEIIAYLPHWLKSVDVINRLICNGGGAGIIVEMVNEFRHPPEGIDMKRNSILIMMQNAMRYFGFKQWTVGSHINFVDMGIWDSNYLSVAQFRCPRITHPKRGHAVAFNAPAGPVEFRDLALHVKKHPSGPDALDLTRCVAWACSHPQQSWLFPDDYDKLVNLLGGARNVIPANTDSEAFTRRSNRQVAPLAAPTPTQRRFTAPNGLRAQPPNRARRQPPSRLQRSQQPLTSLNTLNAFHVEAVQKVCHDSSPSFSPPFMRLTRSRVALSSPASVQTFTDKSPSTPQTLAGAYDKGVRKSTRLRKDIFNILPNTSETGELDSPANDYSDVDYTNGSKRKRSGSKDAYQPAPQSAIESSDEEKASDPEPLASPTPTPLPRGRSAAKRARYDIKALADAETTPLIRLKARRHSTIDPTLTSLARDFIKRVPIFVKAPILDPERLTVDNNNVWTFAEIGAQDLWASALSSTRFNNGPRRSAPFRELYRLTQPAMEDASDWAENIRWAKEQYRLFGSKTWTEYDYHLETITDHRRSTHWISQEVIQFAEY